MEVCVWAKTIFPSAISNKDSVPEPPPLPSPHSQTIKVEHCHNIVGENRRRSPNKKHSHPPPHPHTHTHHQIGALPLDCRRKKKETGPPRAPEAAFLGAHLYTSAYVSIRQDNGPQRKRGAACLGAHVSIEKWAREVREREKWESERSERAREVRKREKWESERSERDACLGAHVSIEWPNSKSPGLIPPRCMWMSAGKKIKK